MNKLRHYDNLGTSRFITFSCYRRHKYLEKKSNILAVLKELNNLRNHHQVKILGYVIMPDHVHLVLLPPDGCKLGVLIGQLKAHSARQIIVNQNNVLLRNNGQPAVWQRRCYDHNCRTREITLEKIEYCHKNPVASGLVNSPVQWPWSSYRWYEGCDEIYFEIDGINF